MSKKKHELGFELYKKHNGKISNAEISKRLDTSDSTVRKWKSRYKWNEKLGIDNSVTPTKNKTVTKNIREQERERVIAALKESGTYSPALDLLIEIYLDAFEEYEKLKNEGIAEEKNRKEIARLLGQLGVDGKNKNLFMDYVKKEKKEELPQTNKLVQFRQRMLQ